MSEKTTSERMRERRLLVRKETDYAYEDRPYQRRTLLGFLDRIDEASDLAADIGPMVDPTEHRDWLDGTLAFGDVVGSEKLDSIIRLREVLDEIHRAIPHVEGWCVVKVYKHKGASGSSWRPRVWIACTTREQAEEFAPAIERHYANRYSNTSNPDRFVVAWGAADATDFVRPGMTADEYVRRLG